MVYSTQPERAAIMPVYRVDVDCEAHEVYYVKADDEANVNRKWVQGDFPEPSASEIAGGSISSVEQADD